MGLPKVKWLIMHRIRSEKDKYLYEIICQICHENRGQESGIRGRGSGAGDFRADAAATRTGL